MPDTIATLDRAIELAQSGRYASLNEIRQHLRREGRGDVAVELRSPAVNQQLVALIQAGRA